MCITMKKVSGSFTVEAAIIIPILLILMVVTIDLGVQMYVESENLLRQIESEELNIVKLFYLQSEIGDLIQDGDSIY